MTTYFKEHRQVYKSKGMAYRYNCVDCNNQALDWSLKHGADKPDINSYEPRCRSCHLKYDMTTKRRLKKYRAPVNEEIKEEFDTLARPGEFNGRARLLETQVIEIRSEYRLGQTSQKEIAIKYKVTESCIRDILNRKNWKHLP